MNNYFLFEFLKDGAAARILKVTDWKSKATTEKKKTKQEKKNEKKEKKDEAKREKEKDKTMSQSMWVMEGQGQLGNKY